MEVLDFIMGRVLLLALSCDLYREKAVALIVVHVGTRDGSRPKCAEWSTKQLQQLSSSWNGSTDTVDINAGTISFTPRTMKWCILWLELESCIICESGNNDSSLDTVMILSGIS